MGCVHSGKNLLYVFFLYSIYFHLWHSSRSLHFVFIVLYVQSHKKAAMFKDKPFQYYRELCIIFGKDRATGVHAETVVDAVEELERERRQ